MHMVQSFLAALASRVGRSKHADASSAGRNRLEPGAAKLPQMVKTNCGKNIF